MDALSAATPEDAARQAWAFMRKPDSTANVFDIADDAGNITRVDLQEINEAAAAGRFASVPNNPVEAARAAVQALRFARDCLVAANAPRAAERTRLALSSATGAVRHVENKAAR
ncbi:hypothetical protein [Mesorhizobium sp. ANAO-SY3R2]|uniref:hypothetical protein n=1 Tax=Mesorhizobium sp. ANAO-SY3R2 TaxID=3166644 RepID=UPI003672CC25